MKGISILMGAFLALTFGATPLALADDDLDEVTIFVLDGMEDLNDDELLSLEEDESEDRVVDGAEHDEPSREGDDGDAELSDSEERLAALREDGMDGEDGDHDEQFEDGAEDHPVEEEEHVMEDEHTDDGLEGDGLEEDGMENDGVGDEDVAELEEEMGEDGVVEEEGEDIV